MRGFLLPAQHSAGLADDTEDGVETLPATSAVISVG